MRTRYASTAFTHAHDTPQLREGDNYTYLGFPAGLYVEAHEVSEVPHGGDHAARHRERAATGRAATRAKAPAKEKRVLQVKPMVTNRTRNEDRQAAVELVLA